MSKELLRALPSIESLLASPSALRLSADLSRERVRDLLRQILDEIREQAHIERVRKNPLMRALRVDKLTYAALEATLRLYERGIARTAVPVLRAMSLSAAEIEERAENFRARLHQQANGSLTIVLEEGDSVIGGGSAPEVKLPTVLLALTSDAESAATIEQRLRNQAIPVIARTERDRVLIDPRTVAAEDEALILEALVAGAQPSQMVTASVD